MSKPNSSVSITNGGGASIASQLLSGTQYQAMVLVDENGQIIGSKDTYLYSVASQVHVAAANTVHWDIWNGSADKTVRIVSIKQIPNIVTAVTGVVFDWQLLRTSAVGTGGTASTAWLPDTTQPAIDAGVTMRLKPTGGATTSGSALASYSISSEETNTSTIQIATQGGLELVPEFLRISGGIAHGIRLGPSQGLKCIQVTNSAAGNTGWIITITIE